MTVGVQIFFCLQVLSEWLLPEFLIVESDAKIIW